MMRVRDPFDETGGPVTAPAGTLLHDVAALHPWDRNPRSISADRLAQLKRMLGHDPGMLWARPLIARPDGTVIMGNMRLRAAVELGWSRIPTIVVEVSDEQAREWALRDNQPSGDWTPDLATLLAEMQGAGTDLDLVGFDEGELARLLGQLEHTDAVERPSLADRFVVPPFSVLDQRAGYWQERRRRWLDLGIQSEIGRAAKVGGFVDSTVKGRTMSTQILGSASGRDPTYYDQKTAAEARLGHPLTPAEFDASGLYVPQTGAGGLTTTGTSVFDPVLCELAYRWFSPLNGRVLDPFAGGSVRGIVASLLGRWYVGVDLSERQVEANREQAAGILSDETDRIPRWIVGDLDLTVAELDDEMFDLIFTCPPYYDLERYSDDERDLSTMTTAAFDAAYARILRAATDLLAPDSFAVIVVSDVRNRTGTYRPLADRTTAIMARLGLGLYNRAMLVSPVGSLPVRVARQFTTSRKLGRTHQDVLVYVKGSGRRAAKRCGQVDVTLDEMQPDVADDVAEPGEETVPVKVSAACARQEFHGCEPAYIEHVCKARCCESASAPGGTLISIHPSEEPALVQLGARIERGRLMTPERRCTFKTPENLCGLHGEEEKPFGCIASPFTLNANDTLIVRNRYRMLRCYRDVGGEWSERGMGAEPLPAYQAFYSSLVLLFGDEEAARLRAHFDAGGGDVVAQMPAATRQIVRDLDAAKH